MTSAPPRVLVFSNQALMVAMINLTLNHGSYDTRAAKSMVQARELIQKWRPHVAVIDMDVADEWFIREISRPPAPCPAEHIPALVLTRKRELQTLLAVIDLGVDDIMLTVPFSPDELLARIVALTRRMCGQSVTLRPVIAKAAVELDILNRQMRAGTSKLRLTSIEQSLLYLFVANAGQVITRDDIWQTLWSADSAAERTVVDRYVRAIRAKLQHDRNASRIVTIAGRGYRFDATVPEQHDSPLKRGVASGGR